MAALFEALVARRDDLAKGADAARAQADEIRTQLSQVQRNIIATDGAVMALSQLIDEETQHGSAQDEGSL